MIDGFWLVHADGAAGSAGGVAFFTNGKVFGGDSGFYYIGSYQEKDGVVKARVAVHNFDPAIQNILSVANDYELHVSGMVKDDTITGTAVIPGVGSQSLAIRLTKKANL
jgi:T3SS negative regulator,GrlR